MYVITCPQGQGANWLANLIYSLQTAKFNLEKPDLNYHNSDQYPHGDSIITRHTFESGQNRTFLGCFCSRRSQFVAFCNGYEKLWKLLWKNRDRVDQFFDLSNDAKWRINSDEFLNEYIKPMVLNADLLVTSPGDFVQKLYFLLDNCKVDYHPNDHKTLVAVENFKKTCCGQRILGDCTNLAWLSWCHAIVLNTEKFLPMDINTQFDRYIDFVQTQNDYFVSYTLERFDLL
jgi:hypothetical protein